MSEYNNNLNVPNTEHAYHTPIPIEIDADVGLLLQSHVEPQLTDERVGNIDSVEPPIDCAELMEIIREDAPVDMTLQSPWPGLSRWPENYSAAATTLDSGLQTLDEEEMDSLSESEIDLVFEDTPPVHGIRFYNPNYQPSPAVNDFSITATTTLHREANASRQNVSQVYYNSRLDLRPVRASVDLTRNRASTNWREYLARLRLSSRRVRFPDEFIVPGRRPRLCAGQPPILVPDHDYDAFVFYNNESDAEGEANLPRLRMVPRRGNSVSDVSQCSSDDESKGP